MTYREFVVPDDVEILETLGVTPEQIDDDGPGTQRLTFENDGHRLVLTYDVLARSVDLHLTQNDATMLDIRREGAVRLVPQWVNAVGSVRIDFDTDELTGSLTLTVHPTISIHDSMLLT
ncbi:MAG TPA: hypothetical protein H9881_05620 [Candidatus Stackebrandtia excrementipullorum]|nr:hypothetical protein [Candidatus Stackebrandtia excrementipullorum]